MLRPTLVITSFIMPGIIWVLYRLLPNSRLKVFLFRVRGSSGGYESPREKFLFRITVVTMLGALWLFCFWLTI